MRILMTGTDGYLGAVMAPALLARGHDLLGVDTGFFRSGWMYNPGTPSPHTVTTDVRRLERRDLEGFDAVVHLAELSNDPLGQLAPEITEEINYHGTMRLARLAKEAGVSRFVYMSSCSVYGVATGNDVDEHSPVNPQTAYARCKVMVERDLGELADAAFSPTLMRNATAFGASPRLRFDLVVNNLAGVAWTTGRIAMTSDGTPWRPLAHARDIAEAVACVLDAPRDEVHGEIFNVGATEHNYQVKEIADAIAQVFSGCELSFGDSGADNRSYRVSFAKIEKRLPAFSCSWSLERGVRELHELFGRVQLTEDDFRSRHHTRLAQLEHLRRTGQIDEHFLWVG